MSAPVPGKNSSHQRSGKDRGFTLFEMIVVVGLILFLSRLTFYHFSGGPNAQQLEGTIKNLGSYFNSASLLAYASKSWVIVVVNNDENSDGYLQQFGTYKWFNDNEPFEDDGDGLYNNGEPYLDINGSGGYDAVISGWQVVDSKGFWLPDKIYFDLDRSGSAIFQSQGDKEGFLPFREYSSGEKFYSFSMEHESGVGPDPEEALDVGRLPYFLDRSGFGASTTNSGQYKKLDNSLNSDSEDLVYRHELDFSNSTEKWIFFLFDPRGHYINIENEKLRGDPLNPNPPDKKLNPEAQRDFIVLTQGVIDFQASGGDTLEIKPLFGRNEPARAALMLHENGTYSVIEDESQFPATP